MQTLHIIMREDFYGELKDREQERFLEKTESQIYRCFFLLTPVISTLINIHAFKEERELYLVLLCARILICFSYVIFIRT